MIDFKIRGTKEAEPNNVIEVWLEKSGGWVNLMATDGKREQVVLSILTDGSVNRLYHFISPLNTDKGFIKINN